mmetsp:Transcript_30861/g.64664  ORF Transcript_30861/g.64664 Transcript_30861/m.64664 type:complete len:244 (+) Transcript_30861:3813-4544(+)
MAQVGGDLKERLVDAPAHHVQRHSRRRHVPALLDQRRRRVVRLFDDIHGFGEPAPEPVPRHPHVLCEGLLQDLLEERHDDGLEDWHVLVGMDRVPVVEGAEALKLLVHRLHVVEAVDHAVDHVHHLDPHRHRRLAEHGLQRRRHHEDGVVELLPQLVPRHEGQQQPPRLAHQRRVLLELSDAVGGGGCTRDLAHADGLLLVPLRPLAGAGLRILRGLGVGGGHPGSSGDVDVDARCNRTDLRH